MAIKEKLERLLRITTHIQEVYDRLLILEKDGKKDSLEYQKTIEYLKMCIENETEIYKKDYNTFDENEKLIRYLEIGCKRVRKSTYDYEDESIVFENDFSNKVAQRIINKLFNVLTDSEEFARLIEEESIKKGSNTEELNKMILDDRIAKNVIYNNLLCNIEQSVNNQNFKPYKDYLIEIKYDIPFVFGFFEEYMLENLFSPSFEHINLTNSQMASSAYLYDKAIEKLLEISDEDYRNSDNAVRAIILQSLVKSHLSLLPKEELLHYLKLLESIKAKEEDSDYKISEKIILLSFKQAIDKKNNKSKTV